MAGDGVRESQLVAHVQFVVEFTDRARRLGHVLAVQRDDVPPGAPALAAQLVLRRREQVVQRLATEVDLGCLLAAPDVEADGVPDPAPPAPRDPPAPPP